jgi:hypothetical protein
VKCHNLRNYIGGLAATPATIKEYAVGKLFSQSGCAGKGGGLAQTHKGGSGSRPPPAPSQPLGEPAHSKHMQDAPCITTHIYSPHPCLPLYDLHATCHVKSQQSGQQFGQIYNKDIGNRLAHLAVLAKVVACRPSSRWGSTAPPAPSLPLHGAPVERCAQRVHHHHLLYGRVQKTNLHTIKCSLAFMA